MKSGTPEYILQIERDIKQQFFSEEYFNKYHSTEIFPKTLKQEILDFINSI